MRIGPIVLTAVAVIAAPVIAACGPDTDDPGGRPNGGSGGGTGAYLTASGVNRVTAPADAPVDQVVGGMAGFGYELLGRLEPGRAETNLVVSPLSIAHAFAMVRAGANGATGDELDEVFGFPADESHGAMNALISGLPTSDGPPPPQPEDGSTRESGDPVPPPTLAIAGGLWLDQDFSVEPDYLRVLAEHYGAGVHLADFAAADENTEAINDWITERTAGRIEAAIDELDESTAFTLVDTVYFVGEWARKFSESRTEPQPFHLASGDVVDVPMMWTKRTTGYAEGDGWQAVELPYVEQELAMWILVPTDASGSADPIELLRPDVLATAREERSSPEVELSLPTWDFATDIDLRPILEELGAAAAFDADLADFTDMAPEVFLTSALHQANITVDEHGTEAAAVTVITGEAGAAPPPVEVEVRADRPFAFAIVDRETGAPLFLGQVADPAVGR